MWKNKHCRQRLVAENEEKRELTRVNAELRAQLAELKHKLSKDTFEGSYKI